MATPRFAVFTGAKRIQGPVRHLLGLELDVTPMAEALAALAERAVPAATAALFQEAERVMTASKEIVPVLTGALRASGHVQLPEVSALDVSVTLGYGGPAAPYAVYVHENVMARHKEGQQAKFLERPMLEAAEGMEGRLADALRAEMG